MYEWMISEHKSKFFSLSFKVFQLPIPKNMRTNRVPRNSKQLNLMFSYVSFLVILFKKNKQEERQVWQYISALLCSIFMASLCLNFLIRTVIVFHESLWVLNEVFISFTIGAIYNEQMYQMFSISSLEANTMFCWPGFCFFQTYTIRINSEKLRTL